MTARILQKPLLKAGSKIRDQAITMTGVPAWRRQVTSSATGRYNTKKVESYGSKERVYLMPSWSEARLALDILDFSEEEDAGVEAFVRMCDDYQEGDQIEFEVEYASEQSTEQFYKVSKVRSEVRNGILTKIIKMVPYRTDNF